MDICLVYLPGPVFCFFKIEVTESFEIPKIRPVARVPVQSIANFTTCLRTSGSYAFLVYSSTKLYRSHAGLLHRYTCFPALLCPFLLTLSLPQCGHLIVNVFVAIPLPTFPFSLFSFFVTSLQFLKDITEKIGVKMRLNPQFGVKFEVKILDEKNCHSGVFPVAAFLHTYKCFDSSLSGKISRRDMLYFVIRRTV